MARIAVVTGGASGIGAAIADRLSAKGDTIVVWDLASHPKYESMICDITDPKAVHGACEKTIAHHKAIDVLVCSAGITGPNVPLLDYEFSDWQRVFDINLHGLMLCNQAVAREMVKKDYGRIVNIASVAGKEGNPNASAYSASKAGVIGLTKSLGKELAKTGVRVNCVTPAAVKTALFDQMSQQHIDFMLSKIPMGRFGTVDEVASLVVWLASDECSFTTAAVFDCSGGRATY
jgi:2-dehydro-3-deoxy-L-rhamnonate dehydrogenase (NAD+)